MKSENIFKADWFDTKYGLRWWERIILKFKPIHYTIDISNGNGDYPCILLFKKLNDTIVIIARCFLGKEDLLLYTPKKWEKLIMKIIKNEKIKRSTM